MLAKRVKFEIAILSLGALVAVLVLVQKPEHLRWYAPVAGFLVFAGAVFLLTWHGMLTAYVGMLTMGILAGGLPLNLDSWYVGYAAATLAIPTCLAVFGFVTSQGGVIKLLSCLEPPTERV